MKITDDMRKAVEDALPCAKREPDCGYNGSHYWICPRAHLDRFLAALEALPGVYLHGMCVDCTYHSSCSFLEGIDGWSPVDHKIFTCPFWSKADG